MEALIAPHVAATNTGFTGAVNNVREFISDRKRKLLNAVNADPIPFPRQLMEAPLCMQISASSMSLFREPGIRSGLKTRSVEHRAL